jgi:hypothetical protein
VTPPDRPAPAENGRAGNDDPAGAELDRLRRAMYAPGAGPEAAERYRVALHAAAAEPAVLEASAAEPTDAPPATAAPRPPADRRSRRLRAALVAGAALVAAAVAAALLAPRPEPAAAPLRLGPALWSASGTEATSSPALEGKGSALYVRLRCRGEGRVLLALDGRVRSLGCVSRRTYRDDQYFDGAHDEFVLSLSLVGHPAWVVSVHRVLSPIDAGSAGSTRPAPRA